MMINVVMAILARMTRDLGEASTQSADASVAALSTFPQLAATWADTLCACACKACEGTYTYTCQS